MQATAEPKLTFLDMRKPDARLLSILDKSLVKGSSIGVMYENGLRIETRYVSINPTLAETLLSFNTNNRRLKQERRNLYAKEMISGNWGFDGSPLRFSKESVLLDGQTRLSAIIHSGSTFKFIVITGLTPTSFHTMDVPGIRTVSDTAHVAGIKHDTVIGSIVRAVYAIQNKRWSENKGSTRTLSNPEFLKKYSEDAEGYDESTKFAVMLHKKTPIKVLSAAEIGTFHYVLGKKDMDLATDFINKIFLGENISKNSPVMLLRNLLLRIKTDKNFTMTSQEKTKLMVYTWNLLRTGSKAKTLRMPSSFDGTII